MVFINIIINYFKGVVMFHLVQWEINMKVDFPWPSEFFEVFSSPGFTGS